jgi:hypothetical protein
MTTTGAFNTTTITTKKLVFLYKLKNILAFNRSSSSSSSSSKKDDFFMLILFFIQLS